MSYYIGATGEYIWEELLENTTSNVVIANNINFDAGPLTDAIQQTITDALGTAVGELIAPVTEVPSATGVGVVALTALGLLSYYKLNRTAVQDVDSMVYSADYASILTPGMFDDRVRIRYDTNWFSNSFYYEEGVKKGELLTYRPEQGSNILNLDATNIKLGTIENARLPLNYGTQLGIGTSPAVNTNLHIYNVDNPTIRLEAGANGTPGIEFQRGATNDVNVDFKIVNDTGRLKFLSQDEVDTYQTPASEIMRMTRTQLSIYENTEINGNLLLQSVAEGTPTVEFRRGTVSDANKDYRFISQGDIFKLQFQDTLTYYSDTNNQLIWINDTDTIIHKQTEFKANVLIGGDTRTVGYVGIGTTASTALHIYTAAANILRLQTAPVSGTNSIEFMRGNSTDPLTDYRILTDTGGKFKIQYANNLLAYGATDTDLIDLSTTNTIIYKPTEFKGNVGIGTAPHTTYKVDVNGTTQSTAFIGNGAGLTDLGADKISTGSLNLDRITLTTSKLYQNFNQINFAIIDDKIDLPAEYSINITAYDNPTLHSDIRYKGKMSVSYDDRRNIYKLVTSDTSKTDNVAVLKYKAGDRIHIRNIANTEEDFITTTLGATIYLKTVLYKRAFSLTFNKVTDGLSNFTQVFEWESRGFSGVPQVVDYRVQDGSTFPRYNFTKLMTFVVEAGYAYYLMRLWRDPTNGLYNEVALADDFDDYLRAFGAGQTFRLESGYNQLGIDYIPRTYTPPGLSVGSTQELGGVKPRRGMAIDASTGYLDAIPLSSDLITNMNTSHFTNNTGTNKIDISSTYVAPSATKLATARNIAGTAFDGTANINITYGNLSSIPATWGESQIPSLPISKITNLQSTLDGKAPTSHSHAIADVTNLQSTLDGKAPTSHTHSIANITNLQTTLDGKAPTSHTHAIADVTNLQTTLDGKAPTSHTHTIANITNLQTTLDGKAPTSHTHVIGDVTNLQTTLDGKAPTSHSHVIGDVTNLQTSLDAKQATLTSANTIGVFNTTQFVNNVGTSKIDIDVNWKPTTASIADSAMQLVSTRNIAGVGFNGTTSIAIPYFNLDFKPTAGTGITISAGSSTSSPVISATATTLTSASLISILNTNDFTSNVVTNKIDLSNNTSNYVASVNTTLTTAIGTKQNIINSTANQIIIGNGNGATTTNAGLTWTGGNTLNATNFSGNGANINNLNAGNFSSGFLAIARGGTGTDTLLEQSILVGNGANPVATYTGLTYDFANRSLKSDRITGVIQYSATVTNITDASIYVSSTPTTTTAITKNIQTINGEYIISTSSTGSSSIIENIFDNTTSSWTTATSSYVKQAGGTNTTGTNFPTTITTPSLTIYGEWIQVKFPRRTCVDDIRVLPFAGASYPNSIFRWTLLATNNVSGNSWIRVYTNTKTFLTSSEQSLLPALGNTNTIQYLYYRLVVEEILGVTGSATGSTLSLILLNVKFMVKDTIMYNDAIVCIGEPINTAPLANTILDVNGGVHIDGTLTTRNLIVNGTAVSGSKWTTATDTTRIYYNAGNVGIGTNNPTQKLDICGTNPTIRLLDTGTDGNAIIQFRELNDLYGMDIAYIGNLDNKMYIRSYNNSATPVNNITIDRGSGYIGLGTTNPIYKCHIKCTYDNASTGIHLDAGETDTATNKYTLNISPYVIAGGQVGWRFRTQNFTGGTYTPLTLNNYGNVVIGGNLNAVNINCDTSYVLGTEVYARNSFDTRIRSDSGGMYLEMGYIGSAGGLLKIGAYNSVTNIDSGESRDIYFRCNGYRWYFANNGWSVNGLNTSAWVAFSDHRIKENIKKANLKTCYDNVKNINLYRYNYIDGFCKGTKYDRTQLGYVAQQVKEHFPKSVRREKTRIDDKREIPDLASIDVSQINLTLFGAVKQLMRVVEKQSKRIKKLEEMLNIVDDDEVEDDADEPYTRINCEDEVDIDDIEPSEPTEV